MSRRTHLLDVAVQRDADADTISQISLRSVVEVVDGDGVIPWHKAGGKTYMFAGGGCYGTVTIPHPWYEKFTQNRVKLAGVFSLNTVKYQLRDVTGFNVGEHVWWKHKGLDAITSFSSQGCFYLLRHGGNSTVARIPETSFLQLVQQNNCMVFFCQKLGRRGNTMVVQEAARGYSGIGLPLWEQAQLCHRQNSWCQGEVERYTGRRRGISASVTCSWQQTQRCTSLLSAGR